MVTSSTTAIRRVSIIFHSQPTHHDFRYYVALLLTPPLPPQKKQTNKLNIIFFHAIKTLVLFGGDLVAIC